MADRLRDTDGLVERRDKSLDDGIGALGAAMDAQLEASASRDGQGDMGGWEPPMPGNQPPIG